MLSTDLRQVSIYQAATNTARDAMLGCNGSNAIAPSATTKTPVTPAKTAASSGPIKKLVDLKPFPPPKTDVSQHTIFKTKSLFNPSKTPKKLKSPWPE